MARSTSWARALVTGASSGIGEAFARELAGRGSDLVLVARTEPRLKDLAAELEGRHGIAAEVLVADLTDGDQLGRVEERLRHVDRPVDLLINNAGLGSYGPFHEMTVASQEAQIRLNIIALVRLTHAAVATMSLGGTGTVINISSVGGFTPAPQFATYGATKSFVLSFTEAIAEELRGSDVTVSCLAPGYTRTGFQDTAGLEADNVPGALWQDAATVVSAGLDGAARGKVVVVPGAANRAAAAATRLLPSALARRLAAGVAKRQ